MTLYTYLVRKFETRRVYPKDWTLWDEFCVKLLQTVYAHRWRQDIQITRLKKELARATEKATRTHNYLRAAERQGELSFYEALQLSGVFVDMGSDANAKFYDESNRDYSNEFADMNDDEFQSLELLPPRIVGAQSLRTVPT